MSDVDPLGGLGEGTHPLPRESSEPEVPRRREFRRGPPAPTTLALLALLAAMFVVEVAVGGKLGGDSLALFRHDAQRHGVRFLIHESAEMALDLDEPLDLERVRRAV